MVPPPHEGSSARRGRPPRRPGLRAVRTASGNAAGRPPLADAAPAQGWPRRQPLASWRRWDRRPGSGRGRGPAPGRSPLSRRSISMTTCCWPSARRCSSAWSGPAGRRGRRRRARWERHWPGAPRSQFLVTGEAELADSPHVEPGAALPGRPWPPPPPRPGGGRARRRRPGRARGAQGGGEAGAGVDPVAEGGARPSAHGAPAGRP